MFSKVERKYEDENGDVKGEEKNLEHTLLILKGKGGYGGEFESTKSKEPFVYACCCNVSIFFLSNKFQRER